MNSLVQTNNPKIFYSESILKKYSVGKVRYKIHSALRFKKISLEEWRKLLSDNLSNSINERILLVEFLNSLKPGRIETKEFRRMQLVNSLKSTLLEAFCFLLIFLSFWFLGYFFRKLSI